MHWEVAEFIGIRESCWRRVEFKSLFSMMCYIHLKLPCGLREMFYKDLSRSEVASWRKMWPHHRDLSDSPPFASDMTLHSGKSRTTYVTPAICSSLIQIISVCLQQYMHTYFSPEKFTWDWLLSSSDGRPLSWKVDSLRFILCPLL